MFCMLIGIFKRNKLIGLALVGLGLSKVLHNDKLINIHKECQRSVFDKFP